MLQNLLKKTRFNVHLMSLICERDKEQDVKEYVAEVKKIRMSDFFKVR